MSPMRSLGDAGFALETYMLWAAAAHHAEFRLMILLFGV